MSTLLAMLRTSPPVPVVSSTQSSATLSPPPPDHRRFMDVKIKQENFTIDCDSRLAQNLRSLEAAAKKIQLPPHHHLTHPPQSSAILYSYSSSPYHHHHHLQQREEMSDGFHTPSPMSSPVSPAHSTHTTDSGSEYYSTSRKANGPYTVLTTSSHNHISSLPEDISGNTTTAHITLLSGADNNESSMLPSIISPVSATGPYHHLKQVYHDLVSESSPAPESHYPVHVHTLVDPETGERFVASSSSGLHNFHQIPPMEYRHPNGSTVIMDTGSSVNFSEQNNNSIGIDDGGSGGQILVQVDDDGNEGTGKRFAMYSEADDQTDCSTPPTVTGINEQQSTIPCSSPALSAEQSVSVLSTPPPPTKTNSKKEPKEKKGRGGRKSNKEKQEGKADKKPKKEKKEKEPKEKKKRSNRQVCVCIISTL